VAKVTVSFVTGGNDAGLSIETDSERNRDYTGAVKSKFRYGDTAYFRVYTHEPEAVSVCATDGTITDMGIFADVVAGETISFITQDTAETEKPVKSVSQSIWLGKSLGTISVKDPYNVKCSEYPVPADGIIAAASIDYQSAYRLYGLTLTKKDADEYPVVVYVEVSNG